MERSGMRITFILPRAGMGGGTEVVAMYAQQLMRLGHIIRVILLQAQDDPDRSKTEIMAEG